MSMRFENVCTIEVAAFGQHCESYMGSPNTGFPGLQNSIYTDTFHATWKKPWHWEVMDWTGTTMSRSSHTCAGYREKQCCHLKLAGVGYLTSPGKLNGFSLCFPPIVKAWKSESKHLNSFFCCFSFCLLEVSLPQIFQKGQLKLSRQSDTEPARTLSGVSISQSNGYYENNTVLLGFTALQCWCLLVEGSMYKQCS